MDTTKMENCGFMIRARWIQAPGVSTLKSEGFILHFHGGGYFTGGVKQSTGFSQRISKSTGKRVLFLDHDLFPEMPL